jgi:hypothetical protein
MHVCMHVRMRLVVGVVGLAIVVIVIVLLSVAISTQAYRVRSHVVRSAWMDGEYNEEEGEHG